MTMYERLVAKPEHLTPELALSAYMQLFHANTITRHPVVADQQNHLTRVYLALRGIQLDAYTRKPRAVFREVDTAYIMAWNTSDKPFQVTAMVPSPSTGFLMPHPDHKPLPVTVEPGKVVTIQAPYWVQHPARAQPYFLSAPRIGDMYPFMHGESEFGQPFRMPFATANIVISEGSEMIGLDRQIVYRTNDQARGEVREPVQFVPTIDTRLEPASAIWKTGDSVAYTFTVTLTHNTTQVSEGQVELELPKGWRAVAPQPFKMTRLQERQLFTFTVRPGRIPNGDYEVKAFAITQDSARKVAREGTGVITIAYPHVTTQQIAVPAVSHIKVAPLSLPRLRKVGYVRGAADRVPESLMQVGVPVTMITGFDIETKDLSGYQAIIIGPRAFEIDPELPAANDQLVAYARRGGLVITQYQQYGYFLFNYAPYAMTVGGRTPGTTTSAALSRDSTRGAAPPATTTIPTALLGGHDRVTDEHAAVTVVDAASPILRTPNRISAGDWDGWVQERGLYFARSWDSEWKPVFSMHDPGESALEGGLLVSKVGKGTYVYTGLSFFRQLPAGVPGAFRLFSNLLALASPASR
jgi:hypothetical protein